MHIILPVFFPLHLYVALRFLLAPWLGRVELRSLRGAGTGTGAAPPGAKLRYLKRICLGNLISGTACGALWSLLPHPSFHWGAIFGMSSRDLVAAFAIGGGIGGIVGEGIELLLLRRRNGRYATKRRKLLTAKMYLLPATKQERRWWMVVSAMTGYGEELAYRLFLIGYLAVAFHLSAGWALVVSSIIFGFAHLAQGVRSAITTTLVGCFFGMAYLGTGYIWYAMLLHALFNLRLLPELRMVGMFQADSTSSDEDSRLPPTHPA